MSEKKVSGDVAHPPIQPSVSKELRQSKDQQQTMHGDAGQSVEGVPWIPKQRDITGSAKQTAPQVKPASRVFQKVPGGVTNPELQKFGVCEWGYKQVGAQSTPAQKQEVPPKVAFSLFPPTPSTSHSNPHYYNFTPYPSGLQPNQSQDCTFYTLVTKPMGCILPKRQKHLGLEGDIKISELDARIDPQPTTLIENSPTVLKYQTPHFRAATKVRFPPISGSDVWQIGWVQGCSNMDFNITYGGLGVSSWEIPPLRGKQQRFVSDSDGKHYPWYGCTTEVATITGPTSCYTTCHLRMNDNFHPSITWDIPVRNSHEVKLTHLGRDQSFTVWLIAINKSTGQKFVLRTVKWRMRINIAVDHSQALGRRARLLDPIIQDQPVILEPSQNEIPPPEALKAPNANNAQTLIWRPNKGREVVIVPPVSQ